MTQVQEICSVCKRPTRSSEKGSLTGFLFENLYCKCGAAAESGKMKPSSIQYCPTCGLSLPETERVGSFTSYLFQDIRCTCSKENRDVGQKAIQAGRLRLRTRYRMNADSQTRSTARKTAVKNRRVLGSINSISRVGLASGEVVGNNYQLDELIGEGGMGFVFKGRHIRLERTCAIKILAPSAMTESSWAMFQNEAKILAGLNHECICQVYDFGVHREQLPFYAMDYLPGETLEEVLLKQGTLSVGAVIEIFIKLAEVLAYANAKGVIHKDIKPANIMLLPPTPSGVSVKLLDFGIAELTMSNEEKDPDVIGTAAYMSPERFFGGILDHRLDIYSLGCAMFEALTGSLPYESNVFEDLISKHALDPIPLLQSRTGIEFPIEVEAIIRKCLGKTPDDRYQNAAHLAADLQAVLNNEPLQFANDVLERVRQDAAEAAITAVPPKKKKTLPLAAIVATILIGLLVSVVYIVFSSESDRKNGEVVAQEGTTAQPAVGPTDPADPEVPKELVSSLDDVVGKVTGDKEDKGSLVWLWKFDHPRLGKCNAIIEKNKAKLFGQKGKESVGIGRTTNRFVVVQNNVNGSNTELTQELTDKNARMYQGLKVKEEGAQKVAGLNCIRHAIVSRNGDRGLFWTTKEINIAEPIARGIAVSCEVPMGYGMPVRLTFLDGTSKRKKPAFEISSAEYLSKPMATLHRQVDERREFDQSVGETGKTKDGGIVAKQPDGSIETTWADGTVRVESHGGTGFIKRPDGSIEHWGRDSSDCYLRTVTKDGLRSTRYKEGTTLLENRDGSLFYKHPDGSVSTWRVVPTSESQELDLRYKKFTWSVTAIDSDGKKTVRQTQSNPPLLSGHDLFRIVNGLRGKRL